MVYVKNAEINKKIYTSIDNESHYHQIIHGGWMQHLTHLQLIFLCLLIVPLHLLAQDELDDFFEPKTSIGGYGELHYNFNKVGNNAPTKTLDFHRFVLYVGHAWTEKWSFRSEIELEHNLVKDGQGILQLEQAFLNYQHADYLSFQAGVLLVASSFINEYHEPVFFPSVERPEYTKFIIPTTWFGNGIGVYGFYSGFDYRLVIIEGLDGSKFSPSSAIRDARQKGFKANAEEFLYNFRLDYVDIPGLRIGASVSTNDAVVNDSTRNRVNIWEVHARFYARGIYSTFEYGDISYRNGNLERSTGYYFDLGYNLGYLFGWKARLVPWLRWTDYNTAAQTASGGVSEQEYHYKKWVAGIALFPLRNVVLKADYGMKERQSDGQKIKLINLGFGYSFQ